VLGRKRKMKKQTDSPPNGPFSWHRGGGGERLNKSLIGKRRSESTKGELQEIRGGEELRKERKKVHKRDEKELLIVTNEGKGGTVGPGVQS